MAVSYKTPSLRSASSVSQLGAGKRIESADGKRWAISRNQKRALADRRFDIVECWTLKERVNGKIVVVGIQRSEQDALTFCQGK